MHLRPEESAIQGFWLDLGSSVTPDANWERISRLTEEYLELLATGEDGREKLFRDPADGRLWELAPVAPEMPSSPPLLMVIAPARAKEKFGAWG